MLHRNIHRKEEATVHHQSFIYAYELMISLHVFCQTGPPSVFPLNAEKVRICEIMSGGFAVEIQQYVKNVRRFLITFSLC